MSKYSLYRITDVKRLIAKGANINAKDEKGDTPLHIVALFSVSSAMQGDDDKVDKYNEVMKYLVSQGADLDAKNKDGVTPASYYEKLRSRR